MFRSPEVKPDEYNPRIVPDKKEEIANVSCLRKNVIKTLYHNFLWFLYNRSLCIRRDAGKATIFAACETRRWSSIHIILIFITIWVQNRNVVKQWINRDSVFIGWATEPLISNCDRVRWRSTLLCVRNKNPVRFNVISSFRIWIVIVNNW